jgi:hypothetical protein
LNGADFYDLFGPTKVGRTGYSVTVGRRHTLVFDEPRRMDLDVEGRIGGNLDRLPEYQNIGVDVDRLATVKATLAYADIRRSLGYVDDEGDRRWTATLQNDLIDGTAIPGLPRHVRPRHPAADRPHLGLGAKCRPVDAARSIAACRELLFWRVRQ